MTISDRSEFPDELLSLVASRFRLLGDSTRLRLILTLREGEQTVGTIAELAGTSQANTSKHLTALHDAGLVTRRRDGGSVYYKSNGRLPYLLIDAVCSSLDAQTSARHAMLSASPVGGRQS